MERKTKCPKCGAENLSWHSRCQQCGEELHKGEDKLPDFERRGAGFWLSFLSGLIGTGIFGWLAFGAMSDSPRYFYFLGLFAIPLIGIVLCWKWPLAGGIVLILASFLPLFGVMAIPHNRRDPSVVLVIALIVIFITIPLLISGIFFVIRGRKVV